MQRVKKQINGPRIIDLDLILFGDEVVDSGDYLTVPHIRATERAFVLYPLAELDSELTFPDGSKIAELLSKIDYRIEGNKIYQD